VRDGKFNSLDKIINGKMILPVNHSASRFRPLVSAWRFKPNHNGKEVVLLRQTLCRPPAAIVANGRKSMIAHAGTA
jgi:hypothetical protein